MLMNSNQRAIAYSLALLLVLLISLLPVGLDAAMRRRSLFNGVSPTETIVAGVQQPPFVVPISDDISERMVLILEDLGSVNRGRFLALWKTSDETVVIVDELDPVCTFSIYCDTQVSPNGALLAYYDKEGFLTVLDIGTMTAHQVAHGGASGDRFISWSPDSIGL